MPFLSITRHYVRGMAGMSGHGYRWSRPEDQDPGRLGGAGPPSQEVSFLETAALGNLVQAPKEATDPSSVIRALK